ncbi:MAG: high-affinity branched-chain amino acid ABC transporter permease LivM [Candidatus Symbiobacter sp.]|nr:high-affinity branched-chain amino acid ABC transporter permease LivM [Candidatus Symbiobacter sp.]
MNSNSSPHPPASLAALANFRPILVKTLVMGLVVFLVALPMVGVETMVENGVVGLNTRFVWVAWMVGLLMAARLVSLVFAAQIDRFKTIIGQETSHLKTSMGGLLPSSIRQKLPEPTVMILIIAFIIPFLPFSDRYTTDTATTVLIYVMLGWGLNVVVGLAGLLDLGYVAFYAVGAYSYALLARYFGLGFWETLPLAGLIAAIFGVLLGFPVLRLRGDYLAIVTLGFGEIIRVFLLNWQSLTGGPNGISGIPRPSFFGVSLVADETGTSPFSRLFDLDFTPGLRVSFLYFVILFLLVLTDQLVRRLRKLPIGRAWEALREDEIACRALGLNPTLIKLSAFALGAGLGGLAGCFFATRQGFISPESFSFIESATVLAIVVLGGMGSQVGVVVAALFLVLLPEFGRQFSDFRMLGFGMAMIAVMAFRPAGFVGKRKPTVMLHGGEGFGGKGVGSKGVGSPPAAKMGERA